MRRAREGEEQGSSGVHVADRSRGRRERSERASRVLIFESRSFERVAVGPPLQPVKGRAAA